MATSPRLTVWEQAMVARAPRKGGGYPTAEQRAFKTVKDDVARDNAWMAVPALAPVLAPYLAQTALSWAARDPRVGQTVYRVFGDDASAIGKSWTRRNPAKVKDYRDAAGLPSGNSGRFVAEGRLTGTDGVWRRAALKLGDKRGGLDELVVSRPMTNITVKRVSGVNPEF